jgi:hypothetical protein
VDVPDFRVDGFIGAEVGLWKKKTSVPETGPDNLI